MTAVQPHYVLLPGLEGAGHYDGPVRAALARDGSAEVMPIPALPVPDYQLLCDELRPRLPDRPHVIVAESFSGPLAILLARSAPDHLRGLVLVATFACLLHPLRPIARRLVRSIDPRRLPVAPASRVMWRAFDSPARRDALRIDLASIPPEVLSARAMAALEVDLRESQRLTMPVLVLAGRRDLIVPARAARTLFDVAPGAEYRQIDAPHMLLQTRTEQATALIADFVSRRVALN